MRLSGRQVPIGRASRRARSRSLPQHIHGSLDSVIDSDGRSLRPIAATAREVAIRTSELLACLAGVPGVRIFQGVRRAGGELPVIPHVIIAGRRLLLIESVAWPPGTYEISQDGAINCDGVYIGQSVRSLSAAVAYWRAAAPRGYQVKAIVVVYAAAEDDLTLPATRAGDPIDWVRAGNACQVLHRLLPAGRMPAGRMRASKQLVATLIAATSHPA